MTDLLFFIGSVLQPAPAAGVSHQVLISIKSILTTILLAVAVTQAAEQVLLYRWIPVRNLNRKLTLRLHRFGGATAVVLLFVVAGLCWYTVLGLGYSTNTPRLMAHAVLAGLAALVLLTKVALANFFRQYLNFALPLGIAAGLLLLGIFLLTALYHFEGYV